jgi:RNA polymerase sigma-70 factor (ECF subfamily)
VLDAVYAAFGLGWDDAAGADPRGQGLADEAIWLGRVLRMRLPDAAEVRGLLALMLFCDARRAARRTPEGRYVPLSEQDPAAWSAESIGEAERELAAAAKLGQIGRFQLEAAIQSVHSERARGGRTDWDAIAVFYERLLQLAPTLGARVSQAAAVAEARGPSAALPLLDVLDRGAVAIYQPYWAVRAHVTRMLGRADEALDAYDRAIGLTEDPAIRQFLLERRG